MVTIMAMVFFFIIATECGLIDPPLYTVRDSEKYHVGDVVNYMCDEPDTYFFPGVRAYSFECYSNGLWFPELRPCQGI